MAIDGPALDLRGVAKVYAASPALRALDLALEEGETLALLGANGSGKTTLLKIIAGAIEPTLGTGTVLGRDLRRERHLLRGEIGLLAAETYLYDDLTAAENLRFILTMAGRRAERAEVARVLERVGLTGVADHRVRTYSSGMRRRLSLARLLALGPRLLLLDEPYNSLDVDGAALVDEVVRGAVAAGGTAIVATHDAARALALAPRVLYLEAGRRRYDGPSREWGARDAQFVG